MESQDILRVFLPKRERVRKSFYTFDLQSPQGMLSFLEILPVLDGEILKQAFSFVFPEYDTNDLDIKRARAELRGFILHALRNTGAVDSGTSVD